jgi:hypothetical protein
MWMWKQNEKIVDGMNEASVVVVMECEADWVEIEVYLLFWYFISILLVGSIDQQEDFWMHYQVGSFDQQETIMVLKIK